MWRWCRETQFRTVPQQGYFQDFDKGIYTGYTTGSICCIGLLYGTLKGQHGSSTRGFDFNTPLAEVLDGKILCAILWVYREALLWVCYLWTSAVALELM